MPTSFSVREMMTPPLMRLASRGWTCSSHILCISCGTPGMLATTFPYDAHLEGELSLRGSAAEVSHRLGAEIQERLAKAGVEVIEARISHLAYAPEIANAMLRRQQATAIIAARQKIVEGAVGMVEMALELLSAKQVVQLDEERKASMVSNLLVVLCSDRDAQPVVNAGTLYQ